MDYSLHLYGEVRQHLREVLQECAAADRRVAIYGRGEAAELAYLSLKEFGLEPVAIFDGDSGRGVSRHAGAADRRSREVEYDLLIVATLEPSGQQLAALINDGSRRQTVSAAPARAAAAAPERRGARQSRQRALIREEHRWL